MKRRVTPVALLLSLAVAFSSGAGRMAHAQPSSGAAAAERSTVSVRLVGEVGRVRALEDRIASWFEPAQFEVQVENQRYLDPRKVLLPARGVEVWVTLREPKRARLYFATLDPQTHKVRYLLRDLALEAGLDEVGAETLAQAVHLSTVALLEGQDATPRDQVEAALESEPGGVADGAPPDAESTTSRKLEVAPEAPDSALQSAGENTAFAATEAATSPQTASHPQRAFRWVGALGYGVASRGSEGIAHGPGARVGITRAQSLGGALRLSLGLPRSREWHGLSVELWSVSAAAMVTLRAELSPDILVEVFGGPALELVQFEPQSAATSDVVPTRAATELRPELVLGLRLGLQGRPRVLLVPELQVALHQTHYEVRRGPAAQVVADAPRLVPAIGLELEL